MDTSWTLFLDRDGVINEEINKDYVKSLQEFRFLPKAVEALILLRSYFGHIVVVTNQKGVALGLMSQGDLDDIHTYMRTQIEKQGGKIDLIVACTSPYQDAFLRKPQAGMAYAAKKKIPSIHFSKSIMVGNSPSDMLFGRNVGMHTVFLTTTKILEDYQKENADLITDQLWSFAKLFSSK